MDPETCVYRSRPAWRPRCRKCNMKDAVSPASKHESKRDPSGADVYALVQPRFRTRSGFRVPLSERVRNFGGGRIGIGQSLGAMEPKRA